MTIRNHNCLIIGSNSPAGVVDAGPALRLLLAVLMARIALLLETRGDTLALLMVAGTGDLALKSLGPEALGLNLN